MAQDSGEAVRHIESIDMDENACKEDAALEVEVPTTSFFLVERLWSHKLVKAVCEFLREGGHCFGSHLKLDRRSMLW